MPSITWRLHWCVVPGCAAGESIITRDGVWIGQQWLRVSRDRDAHAGVIEREQEMRVCAGKFRRRSTRCGTLRAL